MGRCGTAKLCLIQHGSGSTGYAVPRANSLSPVGGLFLPGFFSCALSKEANGNRQDPADHFRRHKPVENTLRELAGRTHLSRVTGRALVTFLMLQIVGVVTISLTLHILLVKF